MQISRTRIIPAVAISLLVALSALTAQDPARIHGYLRDQSTGEPLMFANVVLVGTVLGAASDVKGFYVITGLPAGAYTVKAMMMGFEALSVPVTLAAGEDLRLDMELPIRVLEAEEVTVTAERTRFERKVEISRVNVSLREIKDTPAFMEADLFRTLQNLPGVKTHNDFSSALVVRGGSPDENLILLDGIEVYNPFHVGGVFSTFNVDALADAEFLAGGFPARYGNRNSSVLEITSREGNSRKSRVLKGSTLGKYWNISNAQGAISLLSSKFLMEGPIYNGSWMLAYRRSYYDQLARLYNWSRGNETNGAYYFYDMNGKAIYNLSPVDRLTLAGYYGRDVLHAALEAGDSELGIDMDWGNYTTSLQWRHVPSSRRVSTLSLARTTYGWNFGVSISLTDSLGGETMANIVQEVGLEDITVKERLVWYVNSNHTVSGGFEAKRLGMDIYMAIGEVPILNQRQSPYIYSTYMQDQWQVSPLLTVLPGLRLTKYELHKQIYAEPRLGLKYRIQENIALKASWGIYKQFLFTNSSEDDILNLVDLWLPVPSYNRAQSVQHFIGGMEWWLGERFYLSAEAYYKPYDVALDINPNSDPSRQDDDYIEGTGKAYGIELLLKRSLGQVTGWVGYTYSRLIKEMDFNSDGDVVELHGEVYDSKYDRPHMFNGVLSVRVDRVTTLGFTTSCSSGQPYTPVVGKVFTQSDFGSYTNPYENLRDITGPRNSGRYAPYFRFDVSLTRDISVFGKPGKFMFQVINITNHFNTLLYVWNHERSPSEVTAYSMFPRLPTVGVEFTL